MTRSCDGVMRSAGGLRTGRFAVIPPAKPGFVSLRATAKDHNGNSVSQTLIRAYRTS